MQVLIRNCLAPDTGVHRSCLCLGPACVPFERFDARLRVPLTGGKPTDPGPSLARSSMRGQVSAPMSVSACSLRGRLVPRLVRAHRPVLSRFPRLRCAASNVLVFLLQGLL